MKEAARGGRRSSKRIELDTTTHAQVKALTALIQAKQLELDALKLGLEAFLQRQTGANLAKEAWHLDTERGTLTRKD